MNQQFQKILSILILAFCPGFLSYSFPADSLKQVQKVFSVLNPIKELQADLEGILDNPDFANALVGVEIRSCETGDFIFRKNASKNNIPASILKLFTTYTALEVLGPNFTYTTNFYLDGVLSKNGEYEGDLIVRGSGDPSISLNFYENPLDFIEKLVDKLEYLGIKTLKGNIIGDASYFDNNYYAPGWSNEDLIYPFSAPISALSIFDNKVDIYLKPSKEIGDKAAIRIVPDNSFISVENFVKTIGTNINSGVIPVKNSKYDIFELYGDIQSDSTNIIEYPISLSISNPTKFFLSLIKQAIEARDIKFRGAMLDDEEIEYEIDYKELQPIFQIVSPPLMKIVEIINQKSHNLAAECLLKTIGKEAFGTGSFSKGIEKIKETVSKLGIPPENLQIFDGSGLSRYNLLQPKYIVDLLYQTYISDLRELFINSLAQPFKDGSLKRRMTHSKAEKNVFAKTGSMNNVSNLCGYVRSKDGEYLAFAIMINNYILPESLAQNLQDIICMRLASFTRKPEQ